MKSVFSEAPITPELVLQQCKLVELELGAFFAAFNLFTPKVLFWTGCWCVDVVSYKHLKCLMNLATATNVQEVLATFYCACILFYFRQIIYSIRDEKSLQNLLTNALQSACRAMNRSDFQVVYEQCLRVFGYGIDTEHRRHSQKLDLPQKPEIFTEKQLQRQIDAMKKMQGQVQKQMDYTLKGLQNYVATPLANGAEPNQRKVDQMVHDLKLLRDVLVNVTPLNIDDPETYVVRAAELADLYGEMSDKMRILNGLKDGSE